MNRYQLDVKKLLCPMPVIRTQNKAKQLQSGDTLDIYATDPGVKEDIPTWCRVNGHRVLSIEEDDNVITLTVEILK